MTKKLYTQNEMNNVLSTHSNIDRLRSVLKELRIKPVRETRTAKRTYRLYSQEQMDALVAWKKNHDAPVQPEPVAAEPVAVATINDALRVLAENQARALAETQGAVSVLAAGLARIENLTRQISSAVNLVLDEMTKPRADLGTLEGLVQGGKDDARAPI